MPTACCLTSDAILIGYLTVEEGAESGDIDWKKHPNAPKGTMTIIVLDHKPDLPTDGTYFFEQASKRFVNENRRTESRRVRSEGERVISEAIARKMAGETLPDWLDAVVSSKLFPPPKF